MKVIIFGGCGFMGLHIAKKLRQNNISVVLVDSKDRLKHLAGNNGYQLIEIDYPYKDVGVFNSLLAEGDVLIHLGWSLVPNNQSFSYKNDIAENLLLSAELFQLAKSANVKKILFASSGGSVYGHVDRVPIDESFPTDPVSSYGVAKLAAEKYLSCLTSSGATEHINFRISNAYGEHLIPSLSPTGLIPALINSIKSDKEIEIWGDGNIVRDFLHVSDISEAFLLAITSLSGSGTFNLGTAKGTKIIELIKIIESRMNKKATLKWKDSRDCDVNKNVLDYSKFNKKTGWKPQVALQHGIDLLNLNSD